MKMPIESANYLHQKNLGLIKFRETNAGCVAELGKMPSAAVPPSLVTIRSLWDRRERTCLVPLMCDLVCMRGGVHAAVFKLSWQLLC